MLLITMFSNHVCPHHLFLSFRILSWGIRAVNVRSIMKHARQRFSRGICAMNTRSRAQTAGGELLSARSRSNGPLGLPSTGPRCLPRSNPGGQADLHDGWSNYLGALDAAEGDSTRLPKYSWHAWGIRAVNIRSIMKHARQRFSWGTCAVNTRSRAHVNN